MRTVYAVNKDLNAQRGGMAYGMDNPYNTRGQYSNGLNSLPINPPQQTPGAAFNMGDYLREQRQNDWRTQLPIGMTGLPQKVSDFQQDVSNIYQPTQQEQLANSAIDQSLATQPQQVQPLPQSDVNQFKHDPTNNQKVYTPDHLAVGAQGAAEFHNQFAPKPQNEQEAAQQNQYAQKALNDLGTIAQAKDPAKQWRKMKQEPFYKDSAFYSGMIGVGLSIMSGANPMQAFQAGMQMSEQESAKNDIANNEDVLRAQGYSDASIEQAKRTGDMSQLQMRQLSPEEKRQQQLEDEQRQNQQANAEWDRRTAIGQANTLEQQKAEDERWNRRREQTISDQKGMVDYRLKAKNDAQMAAAGSAATGFNFQPKLITSEQGGIRNTLNQHNFKQQQLANAEGFLDKAEAAKKAGDDEGARAYYQQYLNSAARGEAGSTRSLQAEDAGHFVEDPSLYTVKGNTIALKSGWAPTDASLSYARKSMNGARDAETQAIKERMHTRVKQLVQGGWPKDRATAFVNQSWNAGVSVDPYNLYAVPDEGGDQGTYGDTNGLTF